MKKHYLFLIVFSLVSISAFPIDWKVVYEENFNSSVTRFYTGNSTIRSSSISGGLLIDWFGEKDQATSNMTFSGFDTKKTHRITIRLANLNNVNGYKYPLYEIDKNGSYKESRKGTDSPAWGLIWGFKDWNNYHYIIFKSLITTDVIGTKRRMTAYTIGSVVSGNRIEDKKWSYSEYEAIVDVGSNFMTVQLQYLAVGSGSEYYINYGDYASNILGTCQLSDWYGSSFGIYIEGGAKVAVDYVKVEVEAHGY
jgi:hypothetical protein